MSDSLSEKFESFPIERDRDQFLRELLRELVGVLQDIVGLEDAEGYISIVGSRIGKLMNQEYREMTNSDRLDHKQVAAAMVDLKQRIQGGFRIESINEEAIILSNTRCPFGTYVEGRPAMCMMTSNVFGRIAADNLGYAAVSIENAIARGDSGCRVVISLTEKKSDASSHVREYYSKA